MPPDPSARPLAGPPTLAELTRCFARIGFLSFGGPAAQIALMHREIVDRQGWVSEKEYLSALSFCMVLPGPEAMQLATWIGWRTHGIRGGLVSGWLFVLPGAVIVLALSALYSAYGQVPLVAALFTGIQAAVLAIVLEALLRVARRALKGPWHWALAVLAFVALFALALPFPVVILAAGLAGAVAARKAAAPALPPPTASLRQTARVVALWSTIWLAPLALLHLWPGGLLAEIGRYFAGLAVLTFGGAYAVLAWMAQDVVAARDWLTAREMLDGLGLAETTPGPLILVTEFVGYVAAAKQGGWMAGVAAALVTLWATFAPCFLWIFAGAPWLARITAAPRLAGALAAITAAVVGVIANLSIWFGLHVLFATVGTLELGPLHMAWPEPSSLRPMAALMALAAGWLLLRRHWPVWKVLLAAAFAGLIAQLSG